MPDQDAVTRRDFARMAVGAAVVPAVAASAEAADAAKPPRPRPPHELLVEILLSRYPHEKLTPEVIELLKSDVAGDLGRGEALAQYKLANSDEPGFVFTP